MNPWIQHIKSYAKDNDMSFGCAITEARASYQTVKQLKSKPALNIELPGEVKGDIQTKTIKIKKSKKSKNPIIEADNNAPKMRRIKIKKASIVEEPEMLGDGIGPSILHQAYGAIKSKNDQRLARQDLQQSRRDHEKEQIENQRLMEIAQAKKASREKRLAKKT
jgi:hypothetical protein